MLSTSGWQPDIQSPPSLGPGLFWCFCSLHAQQVDAAEQVEVAGMVFREQLAEDEPSLSKEQLEARSAEHRSKLVAEAEAKLEQEAKTARSK